MARSFRVLRTFALALIAASLAGRSVLAGDPAADEKTNDSVPESRLAIASPPAPDWDVVAANRKAYRRIAEALSKPATFGFDNTQYGAISAGRNWSWYCRVRRRRPRKRRLQHRPRHARRHPPIRAVW